MIRPNGYVFLCSIETQDECFERKLFGTSEEYKDRYVDVKVGDIVFLYNVEIGRLFGLYEAQSECRKDIVSTAWGGRFPYQVLVKWTIHYDPINAREAGLYPKPIMDAILSQNEVRKIIDSFEATIKPSKIDSFEATNEPLGEEKDFRKAFPTNYLCNDGHKVRSISEVLIDNWLYEHDIAHAYERKVPIEENVYCDFYVKKCNCYVEFWGLEDKKYGNRKAKKLGLYHRYNLRLIQLDSEDIKRLDDVFPQRLREFGINVQ